MTLRRKAAAYLNGALISTVGAKLVPAKPKSLSFRRTGSAAGATRMRVSRDGRDVEVDVRDGTSDWLTFEQIFVDEDYDLRPLARYDDIRRLYDEMVASGQTPLIVDLGANVGFSAIYFHLQWPEARIVGVEPDPQNCDQLRKNSSNIGSVEALPAAIASRPGSLQIKSSTADKNAVRVVPVGSGEGSEVVAVTVPELLDRYAAQGCRPFIVKVDIEGAEADLFSSNVEWVDTVPLLIVELHDWLYPGERTSRNFLSIVAGLDRDFVYLDENVFSIRNGMRNAPMVVAPPWEGTV